jgi:SET domain-containing protein
VSDFQIKRSRIHGRGLFARSPLPRRRKIGELAGKIISERAARRKARTLDCIKIVEFGDGWALDATIESNEFQYVNHSCRPNTFLRSFRHRVEVYTLRDIAPGEELTCDYGETQHEGALPCRCGAEGCRGAL